jgi:hypothetical protein
MNRKGVVYETGRIVDGRSWRPEFDPAETRRELAIIRNDLHCNAVKITGDDIGRVTAVAADALEQGLEPWLSPDVWDQDADAALDYVAEAARSAGELHRQWPGRVVLVVASELTLFTRGIIEGSTVIERAKNPALWDRVRSGSVVDLGGEYRPPDAAPGAGLIGPGDRVADTAGVGSDGDRGELRAAAGQDGGARRPPGRPPACRPRPCR